VTDPSLSTRSSAIDAEAFIHEQLGFVVLHAGMGQSYLEAGDTPGFRYSLSSLVARVKAVAGIVNDLSAKAPSKQGGR